MCVCVCVRLLDARLFVRDNIKLIVFADIRFFFAAAAALIHFRALKTRAFSLRARFLPWFLCANVINEP